MRTRHVTWPQLGSHTVHSIIPGWVGGGQLGATDIDLTQTSEWQPNLSEEALWRKNYIKYKTMQRNDGRLIKLRCNMEFSTVSVHIVHLNLRLSATVIRVTFVPNPWALGFLNLTSQ